MCPFPLMCMSMTALFHKCRWVPSPWDQMTKIPPEQFTGVRNKWDSGGVSDTMEQPTWQ